MSNTDTVFAAMPVNAPQTVTWWIASYYPTDADGQIAMTIGYQFKTYDAAITYARAILATAGVGVVYVEKREGACVYNLYKPVPN